MDFIPLRPAPSYSPPVDLAKFINAEKGYLVINEDGSVSAVKLSLSNRARSISSKGSLKGHPPDIDPYTNKQYKQQFWDALCKAEGHAAAQQALIDVGLPNYLGDDSIKLHSSHVKKINEAAKECCRKNLYSKEEKPSSEKSTAMKRKSQQIVIQQPQPQFKKVFPFLAQLEELQNFTSIDDVERCFKEISEYRADPFAIKNMSLLRNDDRTFLCGVLSIITQIKTVQILYAQMAINPQGWNEIIAVLQDKIDFFSECFVLLNKFNPQTDKGIQLRECLVGELKHQIKWLRVKKISIEQVRDRDPFSEKRVAHSNYIWAQVIEKLFDDAQQLCQETPTKGQLINGFIVERLKIKNFIKEKKEKVDFANSEARVAIPKVIVGIATHDDHPVVKGKQEALNFLYELLRKIGFSTDEAGQFIQSKAALDALRRVLKDQNLPPDKQTVVASLNGITGCYQMETTYVEGWVSSAETTADGIPRNFKVHRLTKRRNDGKDELLLIVIGHGVLDMWGIEDKQKRADSNSEAAMKVVCKAAESNSRVVRKCSEGVKPRLTHVSFLLVTPTTLTQLPVVKKKTINFHEKDYTDAQFAAFDNVNKQGYVLVNKHPVAAEVITFSFGINKLSTGELNSKVTGGWSNVDEHNRVSMQQLIGYLSPDLDASSARLQNRSPGCVIGRVMKQVEASRHLTPEKKQAFLIKLQQQTETVREIFLTGAYKQSSGDPAKINREIIVLLSHAENALAAIDADEAITTSKGCKSDKDRGGEVITEVWHELIVEDLGGSITPNEKLDGEKKAIYLNVATTQFGIQTANTGLPGNKAVGWALSEDEHIFLRGLSPFAKE